MTRSGSIKATSVQGVAPITGIGLNEGDDGLGDLFHSLEELRLVGVPALGLGHERLDTGVFHDVGDVSIDVRCESSVTVCQMDTTRQDCLWTSGLFTKEALRTVRDNASARRPPAG